MDADLKIRLMLACCELKNSFMLVVDTGVFSAYVIAHTGFRFMLVSISYAPAAQLALSGLHAMDSPVRGFGYCAYLRTQTRRFQYDRVSHVLVTSLTA